MIPTLNPHQEASARLRRRRLPAEHRRFARVVDEYPLGYVEQLARPLTHRGGSPARHRSELVRVAGAMSDGRAPLAGQGSP